MKPGALFVLLCMAISSFGAGQEKTVPEIPFESVPNLLKLPNDLYLGEVSGVAVNSKGHIFVYTRQRPNPAFRIRCQGRVRPRNRQGLIWLRFRACGSHRQG